MVEAIEATNMSRRSLCDHFLGTSMAFRIPIRELSVACAFCRHSGQFHNRVARL
jgi:hypothetical protein